MKDLRRTKMYNRYINVTKDFEKMNEHTSKIEPLIRNAKFNSEEDKEKVIDWSRETFFNQWKRKGKQA